MQLKFSQLFSDAPQVPFANIAHVFQEEFGRLPSGPDGIFVEFEENARNRRSGDLRDRASSDHDLLRAPRPRGPTT